MTRLYALVVVLLISTATLSAQQTTKWAVGVRGGCDLELIGRYTGLGEVAGKPMYLEGRFGTILAFASEFTPREQPSPRGSAQSLASHRREISRLMRASQSVRADGRQPIAGYWPARWCD